MVSRRPWKAVVAMLVAWGCLPLPPCMGKDAIGAAAPDVADGTYEIRICNENCAEGAEVIPGVLVVDRSGASFKDAADVMRSLMQTDSGEREVDYCYYFDPDVDSIKNTLFAYDTVGFGAVVKRGGGREAFLFSVQSPDYRQIAEIQSVNSEGFSANWADSLISGRAAGSRDYPEVVLRGKKTSGPNAKICFDAARRHRSRELDWFCRETSGAKCEAPATEAAD